MSIGALAASGRAAMRPLAHAARRLSRRATRHARSGGMFRGRSAHSPLRRVIPHYHLGPMGIAVSQRWPALARSRRCVGVSSGAVSPASRLAWRRLTPEQPFASARPSLLFAALPCRSALGFAAPRHQGASAMTSPNGPLRIGIGGPVGSGKTTLTEKLCKALRDEFSIAVVTNDIYTKEDAMMLARLQALPEDRIMGVETGGCPHTAIREDASINLQAIAAMRQRHPRSRHRLHRIRRRQSRRDLLARSRRSHALCHLGLPGRGNPAQGRARHHALGFPGHQQERPRALCERQSRRDAARRGQDARQRGRSASPTCRAARACRR